MGLGSITYFMCTKYCREHGIEYENWDDFAEVIMLMDAAYQEHVAKERPAPPDKTQTKDDDNG